MDTRRPIFTLQCLIYIPVTVVVNDIITVLGECFSIVGESGQTHKCCSSRSAIHVCTCMSIKVYYLLDIQVGSNRDVCYAQYLVWCLVSLLLLIIVAFSLIVS